jgi:hypothetical protein
MSRLAMITALALLMSAPFVAGAKAEDTTVIQKDQPESSSTTVVKKRDDINLLPIPHTDERKTVIHKEHDED